MTDNLIKGVCIKLLNEILEYLSTIDFREIIYAGFGSFLGFGLTVFLEKKSENKNKKEILIRALKNIGLELSGIAGAITKALANNQQSKLIIDTPIYESLVRSGNILMFIEEDYYSELIETYALIKYLHEREIDISISYEEKTALRVKVQNDIQTLLPKFKELKRNNYYLELVQGNDSNDRQ